MPAFTGGKDGVRMDNYEVMALVAAVAGTWLVMVIRSRRDRVEEEPGPLPRRSDPPTEVLEDDALTRSDD